LAVAVSKALSRDDSMKPNPRKIAFHILMLVATFVILSLVAIWLGLGPVVHSETIPR
jgi:hypothetical protein